MSRKRSRQTDLQFRTHGGARRGAGRKPNGPRAGVSHASRPLLSGREPVLVTLKVHRHVSNLRTRAAFERVLEAFEKARIRLGVRIIQFSVQGDHVHLVVEALDRVCLSRAIQGLSVRIARKLNKLMRRMGEVFSDRFHSRVLYTPRQVRRALAYVLCDARKHGIAPRDGLWVDPRSSAVGFFGWSVLVECMLGQVPPVARPRTWLLRRGWWRAGGPIDPVSCPGPF